MGGLKDQLLKAGLVNEKQAKKAQLEKRKEIRQQQGAPSGVAEQAKQQALQAKAEKAERDRQINLQIKEEAEKKALAAQVRQLIETHRQPKGEGETPYNFVDGSTVKKLYLSDKVRGLIANGRLAIVKLDQQYELVPAEIADRIRQRDASHVVLQNPTQPDSSPDQAEDPYSAYQVPDDLIW